MSALPGTRKAPRRSDPDFAIKNASVSKTGAFLFTPYRQGKIPPEINNRQIRPGKIISWLILDVSKSSNGTNDMIWVPKQDD